MRGGEGVVVKEESFDGDIGHKTKLVSNTKDLSHVFHVLNALYQLSHSRFNSEIFNQNQYDKQIYRLNNTQENHLKPSCNTNKQRM